MIEAPPLRIFFTVYGQAAPAGSKRHVGNGRIVDSSKRSAPWKNLVAEYAAQAMDETLDSRGYDVEERHLEAARIHARLLDGPLAVKMVFYVPRPKGHLRKGWTTRVECQRCAIIWEDVPGPQSCTNCGGVMFVTTRPPLVPSAPVWPTTRPDVLKLARAVEDACTGVIWRDDSQIVTEHLTKKFGEPARVEVTVTEA